MNGQPAKDVALETPAEESVAQYLQEHPDFFDRYPQVLTRLRLHHPRQGATISLIERQVEVLRQRYDVQEQKLAEFVRVARANDQLAEKIHRFTRRLLRTATRLEAIAALESSLREDFDAFHTVLVLSAALENAADAGRFLRYAAAEDPAFRGFESLFSSGRPRCGQIRDTQRTFLFGSDGADIGSVALIPLPGLSSPGLLALGSVDRDRFHPGMSTEFLARMADLISDTLQRP